MAIPIKGIPTLYGEEARRMRDILDENERLYMQSAKQDRSKASCVVMARKIWGDYMRRCDERRGMANAEAQI